jgi:spermidine synthase
MTCLKHGALFSALWLAFNARGVVVFEAHSPYHQVQVIDEPGVRVLSFNGTRETKMSLSNPLQGHFEYTEYFHTPWVWNRDIQRVLMLGLGGGSIQRAYQHYYTNVMVDTVELDPVVVKVAKEYFKVQETPTLKIHNQDGRMFLNRTSENYDLIILDAYTKSRYGSSIPPHLTTKEFFTLAGSHLTTNGVLAYNVIGDIQDSRPEIVGALYRTLKEIFPHVYAFPASSSMNVVLVATKSAVPFDYARVQREGTALAQAKKVTMPTFAARLKVFRNAPPRSVGVSPVLTDDRAPVETLMGGGGVSR